MLTIGTYGLDLPIAQESNKPILPAPSEQVASFIGPKLYQAPLMIQDNVIYKPNPPSEYVEKPKPKSSKVYAALVETIIVGQPKQDMAVGDKVGDGECVTFAKVFLGVGGTWGYGGRNLSANSEPVIGAVVLFYGHVAVIIGMQADGGLIIAESNYHLNHRVTMGRVVYIGDKSIRGYHKF